MLKSIMVGIILLGCLNLFSQSTDDIRFTSGEGPFPFYVSGNLGLNGSKSLFKGFVTDYAKQNQTAPKGTMFSWELILGTTLNCRHCLAIKDFNLRGWAVEISYMTAARKLNIFQGKRLHVVENTGGFRFIYRCSAFYPITFQAHAGLDVYSFYELREEVRTDSTFRVKRLRAGSSLLERNRNNFSGLFPGYDLRFRIAIVDPTGVGSGIGYYLEYSFHGKWHREHLGTAYELFINFPPYRIDNKRRNFGRLSVGVVVPLALRAY